MLTIAVLRVRQQGRWTNSRLPQSIGTLNAIEIRAWRALVAGNPVRVKEENNSCSGTNYCYDCAYASGFYHLIGSTIVLRCGEDSARDVAVPFTKSRQGHFQIPAAFFPDKINKLSCGTQNYSIKKLVAWKCKFNGAYLTKGFLYLWYSWLADDDITPADFFLSVNSRSRYSVT